MRTATTAYHEIYLVCCSLIEFMDHVHTDDWHERAEILMHK